mgnify:CR=1 FL=1
MKHTTFAILIAIGLVSPTSADWLQFRGPGGLGIAPDKGTPLAWSAYSNFTWKTAMPGPGALAIVSLPER